MGCISPVSQIEPYGDISTGYLTYLNTELDPDVKAVAVGFDPYINYVKVVKAASYLDRPGSVYVATNSDSFFPTKGDVRLPGNLVTWAWGVAFRIWVQLAVTAFTHHGCY